MKRYFSYISLILASIVLPDEITLTILTPFFTVDTEAPSAEWIYPLEGDEFDGGEIITLGWNASDINLTDNPIAIEFKAELGSQYEVIFSNIENFGSIDFNLPDISTEYARFKVVANDQYGYQNYSESNYFTIIGSGNDDGGDDGGLFEQEITLTTLTNFFTVDTEMPDVEVTYPNGGETFNQGQMVNVIWSASDINLADSPVSISLSVGQGGSYETIAYSLENLGQYTATLPYISTEYARFKVEVFDTFGYSNSDESDEYFTIGQTEDEEYLDSTLVITALTDFFTVDTEDPSITIIYPNGGEFVDNPANVNLQWSVSDVNLETATINASVASGLGGYYILVDSDIPSDQTSSNVNMSAVEQTLWARVQMDVTDDFGNSSSDKSDGYFILGNPEGELDSEWLSEEENLIVLDWGWQIGQLIVIHRNAITSLEIGDEIQIIDPNGILDESCDGGNGELVLSSLTYSGEEGHLAFKALCGSDLCEEGGTRYEGYVQGNDILIRYTSVSDNEMVTLIPNIEMIIGSLTFDDGITIISGFEEFEGRNVNRRLAGRTRPSISNNRISGFGNHNLNQQSIEQPAISVLDDGNMSISVDDRDYDSYNVYRTTNQANLRDCADTPGCNMDGGQCVCLIANNVSQNYYFDNYSSPTEQEGWCYDVWLLDNEEEEILNSSPPLG